MATTFHDALLWHMERYGPTISALAKGAGVSVDTIKQLRARPGAGTGAENGRRIAAYYGKTLDQFMRCEVAPDDEASFIALVGLLTEDEREILVRQVRGMIAGRATQSK